MSWTDDRVLLLKKLWGEGKTAAEIASALGGVTRNAVIGKAHRLKLSNRVSPIQQNKKPANTSQKPEVKTKAAIIAQSNEEGGAYSLLELKSSQCRWPIGDPKHENFGFCGASRISGVPYCEEHAIAAYQPATRNRILQADKAQKSGKKTATAVTPTKKKAASA